MNNFKKINLDDQKNIYGGGFFTALIALIPLLTTSIISIVGAIKVAQSTSGEVKVDKISQKFEIEDKNTFSTNKNFEKPPIYFVY